MPIHGNADPYIVCEFIDDDNIFVALFNNYSLMHYHFIYSVNNRNISSKVVSIKFDDSTIKENFPVKAFYNPRIQEIYVFYKMGQGITIPSEKGQLNLEDYQMEKITDKDFGQMYIIDHKYLIVTCGIQINFYKRQFNDVGIKEWT